MSKKKEVPISTPEPKQPKAVIGELFKLENGVSIYAFTLVSEAIGLQIKLFLDIFARKVYLDEQAQRPLENAEVISLHPVGPEQARVLINNGKLSGEYVVEPAETSRFRSATVKVPYHQ